MYIKRGIKNRTEMYKEEKCGHTDRWNRVASEKVGVISMLNFLCGMWAGSTIGVLVMCLIQGGKEGEVREDKEK